MNPDSLVSCWQNVIWQLEQSVTMHTADRHVWEMYDPTTPELLEQVGLDPFREHRVLMSISRLVTGRYELCTVRWKFSCCMRSSSSFKIISEAFSRSPLMLATNSCIEMLNSSTLHAKYTHVTRICFGW